MLATESIDQLREGLPGISLDELDERASLLQRTDTKYVLDTDAFIELLRGLDSDYQVLDIDGRRRFGYRSVYFDAPDLVCFRDHVDDRRPRLKARTRLYRDSERCVFEVKLKSEDGATEKHQTTHPVTAANRLTPEAIRCLRAALAEIGRELPPDELGPSLRTTFTRMTLAPRQDTERVTCDFDLCLERQAVAGTARLHERLVILETKSEGGNGPTDQALRAMGIESMSLSKYRAGIGLLVPGVKDPEALRDAERLFDVR